MAAPTLDEFRDWVGGDGPPTQDDATTARLTEALATATASLERRCLAQFVDPLDADYTEYPQDLHTAILLEANRLFSRAPSPQGVAGFDQLGNLFRVSNQDPDVEALIGPFLDLATFA